jgi:hypothetical protein
VDTVRYTFLLHLSVSSNYPCLFVGPTGTGKSVYILKHLTALDSAIFAPSIIIGFSARTGANMTQHMVDAKLDRRRKGVYGPAASKRVVVFVDDMNMPQPETYGAQPPIEILRQYMDHEGWCVSVDTLQAHLMVLVVMSLNLCVSAWKQLSVDVRLFGLQPNCSATGNNQMVFFFIPLATCCCRCGRGQGCHHAPRRTLWAILSVAYLPWPFLSSF